MSPPGSGTSTTRYRLAPDVRFRVVGDEGVVVRQDAGEVLVVNGVAARVLELLDRRRRTESTSERGPERDLQGRSVNELIGRLGEEYEAPEEEIARDLHEFLVEAVAGGIVETLEQADEP